MFGIQWEGLTRRLVKAISLCSSVAYALMIMNFFFNPYWQGYVPADDNAGVTAMLTIGMIGVAYLVVEYLDAKMGAALSVSEAKTEKFLSGLPVAAFVSVATAWWFGDVVVSGFQFGAGVFLLMVVVLDMLGFAANLLDIFISTMKGLVFRPMTASPAKK